MQGVTRPCKTVGRSDLFSRKIQFNPVQSSSIQFPHSHPVLSTQSSSASRIETTGRNEGRNEEKSGFVAKPVGATTRSANENAHRVSLGLRSLCLLCVSVRVCMYPGVLWICSLSALYCPVLSSTEYASIPPSSSLYVSSSSVCFAIAKSGSAIIYRFLSR